MACVMAGVTDLQNEIYLNQRGKDYMGKEVTVVKLDVLFRDSTGGSVEKNREKRNQQRGRGPNPGPPETVANIRLRYSVF